MSGSVLISTAMLQFLAGYMVIVITPGPIALTTGSLASLYGFARMIPLLAGIGVGTAVLATLMAFGAVRLAASLPPPTVEIASAAVLGGMAWRIACMAPPAAAEPPRKLQASLFVGGVLIGFLSPQTASFLAVVFAGMMLPIQNTGDAFLVVAVTTLLGVGWYGFVAAALSRPAVRAAALRRHRAICRGAGFTLALLALASALSALSPS
ncbi:LysE family transporter [Chelativorans sp. M5D2P16]|uniref:LysE family transporter n=1 Tax=Chelativorans sp. M5D2P16 TaxID=3095678 RepID=UPI002ACA04AF|nr:LysE family transporter [Chelativorans sp. M5D2P16]MDZ5697993.1 LysE family transporter [Chelativorans sp. M5D2P16]